MRRRRQRDRSRNQQDLAALRRAGDAVDGNDGEPKSVSPEVSAFLDALAAVVTRLVGKVKRKGDKAGEPRQNKGG